MTRLTCPEKLDSRTAEEIANGEGEAPRATPSPHAPAKPAKPKKWPAATVKSTRAEITERGLVVSYSAAILQGIKKDDPLRGHKVAERAEPLFAPVVQRDLGLTQSAFVHFTRMVAEYGRWEWMQDDTLEQVFSWEQGVTRENWRICLARHAAPPRPEWYRLEGKTAVPSTLESHGQWFTTHSPVVAQDAWGDWSVLTRFIGRDVNEDKIGAPLLFETTACLRGPPKAPSLYDSWRGVDAGHRLYTTWEQAEAGHAEVVAEAKAGALPTARALLAKGSK